jgi:hypothetical protein
MNNGAVMGICLVLIALLLWLFGIDENQSIIPSLLNNIFIIGFLVYSIRLYRDNINNGFITFSESLRLGTSIAFFSSIIMAFYTFIYITYLSPDTLANMLLMTEQAVLSSNSEISEAEIDLALEMTAKFTQPHWLMILGVLSGTFVGFLYSAIISFFVKHSNPNQIV